MCYIVRKKLSNKSRRCFKGLIKPNYDPNQSKIQLNFVRALDSVFS